MTSTTNMSKRRAATAVVATSLATGLVALPGVAAADACGGDPFETVFCVVEQALEFDPFTVVDKVRDISDRGREFGQQVNDNNRQFYREQLNYPSRLDMVVEFANEQQAGLADDRAAIDAAVEAAGGHATGKAEEASDDAGERQAEIERKVAEERKKADDRKEDELRQADERAEEAKSDANHAQNEAMETKDETVADTEQQVQDQIDYDWQPGKNYVNNTREDVEDFAGDVSPVKPPTSPSPSTPSSGGSGGTGGTGSGGTAPATTLDDIVEDVTDLVDDLVSPLV